MPRTTSSRNGTSCSASQAAIRGSGRAPRLSALETKHQRTPASSSVDGDAAGRERGVDVAVARRAPLELRVRGPLDRLVVVCASSFGSMPCRKSSGSGWSSSPACARSRSSDGGRVVGESMSSSGSRAPVLAAHRQGLDGDDVEEARARLDLERRLRPVEAHAGPEAAVELHDGEAVEHRAGGRLVGLGQLLEPGEGLDGGELVAGQRAGAGRGQLGEPPAERGELHRVGARLLQLDDGRVVGAHGSPGRPW